MSFVFERPQVNVGDTFAGGEASLGDIYAAALDQAKYVDNLTASAGAMEAAIDERNKEVFRDTGVRLDNPYRAKFSAALEDAAMQEQRRFSAMQGGEAQPDQDPAAVIRKGVADWQHQVEIAAARIPDTNVANRLNRSIEGDAIRIARQSDEKLGQLMASRPGLAGMGAAVAGGFAGTLRDPLQLSLMTFGGGPGAGRTVASRILSTAAKEAFINGASEAALQPVVQAWRKQAGLDNGLDVALRNIATAAAFGGFVGGGLHGAGEAAGRLFGRGLDAAGEAAAADPRVAEPLRQAMQGDTRAAAGELSKIREALPAEARGALDQVETLDHLDATRPRAVSPEQHDVAIAAAHRAVDDGQPLTLANPDQVARITNDIVGEAPADVKQPRSLAGFLIDHGGIQDFQGELAAIGADKVSEKFRGRLVKKDGMTLDQAREAAEQAGYIGRPGEVQTTSVADLLSSLEEDLRGNPVLARADQADIGRAGDFEARRAGVERTVAEISAASGPGVDDAIVHQAARLSIDEGMHPLDALESVLVRSEDTFSSMDEPAAQKHVEGTMRDVLQEIGARRLTIQKMLAEQAVRPGQWAAVITPDGKFNMLPENMAGHVELERLLAQRLHSWRLPLVRLTGLGEKEAGISIDAAGITYAQVSSTKAYMTYARREGLNVIAQRFDEPVTLSDIDRIPGAKFKDLVTATAGREAEPLPGWSDAELQRASAGRGLEPEPGAMPDPATVDPELEISPAEIKEFGGMMLPGEDGRLMSLEAYVDDIKHGDELAAIVKACRA